MCPSMVYYLALSKSQFCLTKIHVWVSVVVGYKKNTHPHPHSHNSQLGKLVTNYRNSKG